MIHQYQTAIISSIRQETPGVKTFTVTQMMVVL